VTSSPEEELKAELEGSKMMVDVAKHPTTLSSGSILLLTTLLRDIFTEPQLECTELRSWILLAFLLSTIFAVAVAWMIPLRVLYGPRRDLRTLQGIDLFLSKTRSWSYRLSAISFFVGVLLLSVFGAVNFGMQIPLLECDT